MRKQYTFGLLSLLLITGACSGDGAAVVTTTTTVPVTTTTVDAETLKESQRSDFKSELFQNLKWYHGFDSPDAPAIPSKFFAETEDIQQVLRKGGISGFVLTHSVPWALGTIPQRKLCDDVSLDDVIAELEPTNVVGRFFHWDYKQEFSRDAVLAAGGMHVFDIPSSEKLRGFAGSVVDSFNAGGGECQVRPNLYSVSGEASSYLDTWETLPFEQWWNDQKLVDSGIATLEVGRVKFETMLQDQAAEVGFQFLQYGIDWNWIRDFFVVTYPKLGLMVLIEVNLYENLPTGKSLSTVEFADKYLDVIAGLQSSLFRNLENYILENDLGY